MLKFWYPRTVWLFCISIGVILLAVGLFRFYLPNMAEADLWFKNAEELRTQAGKTRQVETKIKKANELIAGAEARWNGYVATRTPADNLADGGMNLNVNAWQLMVDTKRYRNNIQRAVNKQVVKGGIRVLTGPYITGIQDSDPANQILANYYNYPAFPFPVVLFDLGTVTVQGTYDQIMAHYKSWATMPRYLAVVDGLRLDGTAPILTATYSLTIVGYLKDTGMYPPVPEGAAAAPAGGGFGGGAPGGMPGRGGGPGMMGGGQPAFGAASGPGGGRSGPPPGMMGGGQPSMAGPSGGR